MAKNPTKFESAFHTYTVVGVIGEGGAGRVFEAKNAAGNTFAIKCLTPSLITTEKQKRFKNEIDFCSRNEHANIIRVIDSGPVEWEGIKTSFYVMPKYAGTLRGLMEKKIPPDDVLRMFNQVLQGVEAAHLLGVIHRDLKPENVLYDPEKRLLVVGDFGIAHFEEEIIATAVETKKADKLANIGYSAPEQRAKGAPVDRRADIYALAQILNEMFTGAIPEGAGHATIAAVAPAYAYLDGLVERMRQQNPAARPASIEEVKKELIGRKNEFVALQELDAQKRVVIPSAVPNEVAPVNPVEALWDRGVLTISLDRAPEHGWIQKFWQPRDSISYLMSLPPIVYQFQGNTVHVQVEERYAQTAIDQFKTWTAHATRAYQEEVNQAAATRERERRRALEQEVAAAEAKARVNRNLKV